MNLAIAAGAGAAAVLAAVAAGWRYRRRRPVRIDDPAEAADAANAALPGFRTVGAVVGGDGLAALAVAEGGRVAAIRRRGGRVLVCETGWSRIRVTFQGVVIETEDRRFGTVTVTGVDALDVRRLAPRGAL